MAINKVVYDGEPLIDITDTTAAEGDVASGKTFYKSNGTRAIGTAKKGLLPAWNTISPEGLVGNTDITINLGIKAADLHGFVFETRGSARREARVYLPEYGAVHFGTAVNGTWTTQASMSTLGVATAGSGANAASRIQGVDDDGNVLIRLPNQTVMNAVTNILWYAW